jgi:hypothetical protein
MCVVLGVGACDAEYSCAMRGAGVCDDECSYTMKGTGGSPTLQTQAQYTKIQCSRATLPFNEQPPTETGRIIVSRCTPYKWYGEGE